MELPSYSKRLPASRGRMPYRRRRVIWTVMFLTCICIFFFAPDSFWEKSDRLRELSGEYLSSFKSPSRFTDDQGIPDPKDELHQKSSEDKPGGKWNNPPPPPPQTELQQLLHMVSSSELTIPVDVDASQPLDPLVYDPVGEEDVSWLQSASKDPPVIVFSKTTCPYSRKAKELLALYDLSPPPKIVEVDLRPDTAQLKAILTRLTGRPTFPNIFIQGKSIGGSDELHQLHEDAQLTTLLNDAGVSILADE